MYNKSDKEWRTQLTGEQFHICREKGTEIPFSGKYVHTKEDGMYHCVACDAPLFSSATKFDSGTGWPSFWDVASSKAVELREDFSHGMSHIEVRCARCGSHLGHVFDDGPKETTGKRYCINSAALTLHKDS